MSSGPVSAFLKRHYRHFNAASVIEAAESFRLHLQNGGEMLLAMAGAMSTAELGLSLAEMIRSGKIHAISCTGANLEEDVFNLVAHESYERVPNWRELRAEDEQALLDRHLNRVTDTCIPEHEAMRRIERSMRAEWKAAEDAGERLFPYELFYRVLRRPEVEAAFQIDPKDSWLHAAMLHNLPIFTPGWEDSTIGNMFAAACIEGVVKDPRTVRGGVEAMMRLAEWYEERSGRTSVGFFQIGGGIAGDFAICVTPMLRQDLSRDVNLWGYFCQISDSTTSYGSYSGAAPTEKITWEKLAVDTPRFVIESDATIVAPLIFAYVLGW